MSELVPFIFEKERLLVTPNDRKLLIEDRMLKGEMIIRYLGNQHAERIDPSTVKMSTATS